MNNVLPDLYRLVEQLPFPVWLLERDGGARGNAAAAQLAAGADAAPSGVAAAGASPMLSIWRNADGSPIEPHESPFQRSLDSGKTVEATLRPAGGGAALRVAVLPLREEALDEDSDGVLGMVVAERPGPASLADWLGDVGHALRSPLSPIRTAAQLLRNPRIADEQRDSLLEIVERQIRELMARIDELADLVRIKRGLVHAECRPCDLSMLLDIVRGRLAARFEEEDRELALPSAPADVAVVVDQAQVVQAMALVLTHAMRHTPAGQAVHCEMSLDAGNATVVVHDQDPRASAERAAALLAPPVERHGAGLGAALFLARSFIEHSGGRFVLAPRDGGGMEFRLSLPLE